MLSIPRIIALASLSLLAVGCGGSSGDDNATDTRVVGASTDAAFNQGFTTNEVGAGSTGTTGINTATTGNRTTGTGTGTGTTGIGTAGSTSPGATDSRTTSFADSAGNTTVGSIPFGLNGSAASPTGSSTSSTGLGSTTGTAGSLNTTGNTGFTTGGFTQ